jgi:glycosyltransferase involved in cell wall biosynthesis
MRNQIKVLVFYDAIGWAWYHKSLQLQKLMPEDINIDVQQLYTDFDHSKYDYILVFDAYPLKKWELNVPYEKLIIGCSNEKILEQTVELVSSGKCRAGFVNNYPSYLKVGESNKFYCCQNGVDEQLFSPRNKKLGPFTACWVGNSKAMAKKGIELIEKACLLTETKLIKVDRQAVEALASGNLLSLEEIRDQVYHQSSVYICASEFEGTPNPALEALSCGLPVISTRVGNMPEILIDGVNGYLVDRSVESIARALIKIKTLNHEMLASNARKSIEQGWTWKQKVENYIQMFRNIAREDLASKQTYNGENIANGSFGNKINTPNQVQLDLYHKDVLSASLPLFREAALLMSNKLDVDINDGKRSTEHPVTYTLSPKSNSFEADITIVIPTFNRPNMLLNAVGSIVSQGYASLEIIIVNDSGPELPESVIEKLSELPFPTTVVRHTVNKGLGSARNTGAGLARGEWMLFLDDDDAIADKSLLQLRNFSRVSKSPFIYGDHIRHFYIDNNIVKREYHRTELDNGKSLAIENVIMSGSFIIRKDFFRRINGYREDFKVHEDYNMHIRVLRAADMEYLNHPVMIYNHYNSVDRMNIGLKPYWFATSALNHVIFRKHFLDESVKINQRTRQYQQIIKALESGASQETAIKLIFSWWDELVRAKLASEIYMDLPIIQKYLPSLISQLDKYKGPGSEALY